MARQMMMRLDHVEKSYTEVKVLDDVSLEVFSEEFTLITGPSGSGKTTLLNMLSSVDTPDEGLVYAVGENIAAMNLKQREKYRARNGQIFQRSGLLGGLTAEQNITAIHDLSGNVIDSAWVNYLITELAIGGLMKKRISEVSGGQAQRIGIVRALAHKPKLIFADEPTASLDADSKHDVHSLLRSVSENGSAVVMVSHDEISRQYADVVFHMDNGRASILDKE